MRRSKQHLVENVKWTTKASRKVLDFVRKNVPNPRDNPVTEKPIPKAKHDKMYPEGFKVGPRPGQAIDEYMLDRDKKWAAEQKNVINDVLGTTEWNTPKHADGTPFMTPGPAPGTSRENYMNLEGHAKLMKEPQIKDYQVEDERLLLRRQLQLDQEMEYRKFIAEMKKTEVATIKEQKKNFQHPSDKSYDPFKTMKGYRPQDSKALADWLQRQRTTGESASGLSLKTKEGQDRFYNEGRMATQYTSNPFSTRIELPAGVRLQAPTAYTPDSVFINDREVIGSAIITQHTYYHWNVGSFDEINEKTCALLLHLYPVPDILFIGTGRNLYMVDEDLKIKFQQRGTVVHCLPTGNALANFMQVHSLCRRVAIAYVNHIPTNPYQTDCFGDFIENDSYCLSDSSLGIPPQRMYLPTDRIVSKVAEKYRDVQGSGYGPRYMEMADGRLVRPGTYGTRLHPLLEPGHEPVEWDKLPSYYNWFPKETVHDYIENNTFREVKGKKPGDPAERRALETSYTKDGDQVMKGTRHTMPEVCELAPWDSASLPVTKMMFEKFDNEVFVEDWKTGRVVGMEKGTYEKYKVMMAERKAGLPESDPIEFDQERFVADKHGNVYDLNQIKYRPIFEGRWNPERATSRGFGSHKKVPT